MRRQEGGVVAAANKEACGEETSAEELATVKMAKVRRALKRTLARGSQQIDGELR